MNFLPPGQSVLLLPLAQQLGLGVLSWTPWPTEVLYSKAAPLKALLGGGWHISCPCS